MGCKRSLFYYIYNMQTDIIPLGKHGIDFVAILKYRTTEEGGRKTPVFKIDSIYKCYGPQVKFYFSEKQTSGAQMFIDKEIVYPGDTVTAKIIMLSTEFFKNKLEIGMGFEFREGGKITGTGQITKIVNENLTK